MRYLIIILLFFNTAQAQIVGVIASSKHKVTSPTPPAVISDGNTVAWYLSDDLSTLTKDALTDEVSIWADKLGSGHDLTQSTATKYPVWGAGGVTFDGVNDFMSTATFTYAQPESIWLVIKQVSWSFNSTFLDGYDKDKMLLRQRGSTPGVAVYSGGSYSSTSNDLAVGSFGIIRIVFDGASSRLVIDGNTPITGNFGTATPSGIMVGSSAGTSNFSNITIKEMIFRKAGYNSTDDTNIYNYLKTKYGL